MYEAHDVNVIGEKTYVNDNRTKLTNQHYYKSSDNELNFLKIYQALKIFNLPFRCSFNSSSKPILINILHLIKMQTVVDQLSKGLEDKFINIFKIDYDKLENEEKYLKYKKRLDHELELC